MGLDITVHPKVVEIDQTTVPRLAYEIDWDECYEQGLTVAYCAEGFERSLGGLVDGHFYRSVDQTWSFRAGSYGGYNDWREWLSFMAHQEHANHFWDKPEEEDVAFIELINFSDCEGTIGLKACADLAKDFDDYRDKAIKSVANSADGKYILEKYELWSKAFHDTANTGLVELH